MLRTRRGEADSRVPPPCPFHWGRGSATRLLLVSSSADAPTPGSALLQPFPLPPSRPRPRPWAHPAQSPPGPPSRRSLRRRQRRGPLLRQLSPAPRAAFAPQAVLASHSSAPRPASVPAFSVLPSQRLEVRPSPCALREAMSRGPGLGPELRLVAEPPEDAAVAAGPTARSAGQAPLGRPRCAGA